MTDLYSERKVTVHHAKVHHRKNIQYRKLIFGGQIVEFSDYIVMIKLRWFIVSLLSNSHLKFKGVFFDFAKCKKIIAFDRKVQGCLFLGWWVCIYTLKVSNIIKVDIFKDRNILGHFVTPTLRYKFQTRAINATTYKSHASNFSTNCHKMLPVD